MQMLVKMFAQKEPTFGVGMLSEAGGEIRWEIRSLWRRCSVSAVPAVATAASGSVERRYRRAIESSMIRWFAAIGCRWPKPTW